MNLIECMEEARDYRGKGDVYIRIQGKDCNIHSYCCGDPLMAMLAMARAMVMIAEQADIPEHMIYEMLGDELKAKRGNNDAE